MAGPALAFGARRLARARTLRHTRHRLLWLTFLPLTQQTVRLAGAPPWLTLAGFYGPEDNGNFSYRWSQPEARLTLPVPPADGYAITLTLQDGPGAATPRPLSIAVNGTLLDTPRPDSTLRAYRVVYTRPASATDTAAPLQLTMRAAPRMAGGDPRELGFAVATVRWEVHGPSPLLRGILVAAQLALLGLGYACLVALRRERRVTPLLAAYTGSALLLWFATSLHPATIVALLALRLLFVARHPLPPALALLNERAGKRWLFTLALLGVWASTPNFFDASNPGNHLRGYVAVLLAGAATVAWTFRRAPRVALGGYAVATLLATARWYWGLAPALVTIPGLPGHDQTAIWLAPWVLIAFAVATVALARLLPAAHVRHLLIGDLLASLAALALPAGVWLARRDPYSDIEQTLNVSWPGGFLVLLLVAKVLVCGVMLYRAAPRVATERRMALALLALLVATSWSLAPWRMATMGLSGDESGYLAAALSLTRDRDLELTNNGYSPWMLDRVQYPNDAWGHEYADPSRDRFVSEQARPAAARHQLPLVAGPDLRGEIGIVNTADFAAQITVRIAATGTTSGGEERFILIPNASRLLPVAADVDWRGATVEASVPVAVAVRLVTATGALDAYRPTEATTRFCVPFPAGDATPMPLLFLHNGTAAPVRPEIVRYLASGEQAANEAPTIPANETFRLPLPAQAAPQTVCVAADGPLTTLGLVQRDATGLLTIPAIATAQTPLAIPPAPTTTHVRGTVALLVHNPGAVPVQVRRAGDGGPPFATLAPHATAQIALDDRTATEDRPVATLETSGPVAAAFVLALGRHETLVAPDTAQTTSWFPAIVGEDRRFVATRVVVQNPSAQPLVVAVALLDDRGATREERRVTLCGGCASAVRLDFADPEGNLIAADGTITVHTERPVLATTTQITTQTHAFQHEWGLPVLLVPGVALADWRGALLTIATCAALLLVQLYGLLREGGIARRASLVAVLALGFAPPLFPFSLLLYPELVAMLLILTGLRLALGAPALRGWRLGGAIACALAIPLLHTRLLPLAALLALCLAWRVSGLATLGRRARRNLLLVLPLPVVVLALWWLARPYLPPPLALSSRLTTTALGYYFSVEGLEHRLAGIAFDRATGLLAVAPLLALAPAGLLALSRRAPRYALWPALFIGLQCAVVGLRAEGWEVWGPAGRYLLPAVPLLGIGVAAAWADWSPRWLRYAGAVLVAWGWLIATFLAWIPHAAYYFVPDRKWFGDLLLRSWAWPNPLRLFPTINNNLPFVPSTALPWLLLLAAITLLGVRWRALFTRAPADVPRTDSSRGSE